MPCCAAIMYVIFRNICIWYTWQQQRENVYNLFSLHSFYYYKYSGKTYTHKISTPSIPVCPCLKKNESSVVIPKKILESKWTYEPSPLTPTLWSIILENNLPFSLLEVGMHFTNCFFLVCYWRNATLSFCSFYIIRKHKAKFNLDLSIVPHFPKITKELNISEHSLPLNLCMTVYSFSLSYNDKPLAQKHYQELGKELLPKELNFSVNPSIMLQHQVIKTCFFSGFGQSCRSEMITSKFGWSNTQSDWVSFLPTLKNTQYH